MGLGRRLHCMQNSTNTVQNGSHAMNPNKCNLHRTIVSLSSHLLCLLLLFSFISYRFLLLCCGSSERTHLSSEELLFLFSPSLPRCRHSVPPPHPQHRYLSCSLLCQVYLTHLFLHASLWMVSSLFVFFSLLFSSLGRSKPFPMSRGIFVQETATCYTSILCRVHVLSVPLCCSVAGRYSWQRRILCLTLLLCKNGSGNSEEAGGCRR